MIYPFILIQSFLVPSITALVLCSPAMAASSTPPPPFPQHRPSTTEDPKTAAIRQRLVRRGVYPTPKIVHAIRKKGAQKAARRAKNHPPESETPTISGSQRNAPEDEDNLFQTISSEYRAVMKPFEARKGVPWERLPLSVGWGRLGERSFDGGKLREDNLEELKLMFEERNARRLNWLLDDDVDGGVRKEAVELGVEGKRKRLGWYQRGGGDQEKISWLVHRLNSTNLSIQDWKFPKLMRQSELLFSENCLLKILDLLGNAGNWQQSLFVVEWVYGEKEYWHSKSRFVYTKLLSVLGKARRPIEALRIYKMMRDDCQIYPDMAAYHSIAVTLGQAGLLKELMNIIECMKLKPTKKLKNMRRRNWEPCLEPDVVIYNAALNACVPTHQWKGVYWVLRQMRFGGLKPNGATYGLAMEVMLEAGKYDFVHKLFGTMQRNGLALKALTYKVLVKAFWREGRIDDAVMAVRDMEQRGIVGAACLYYELACCLCSNGLWKDAMLEVEKMIRLPLTKPLEVAFTGMIQSSMDGGHLDNCISIFKHMKDHCAPNIGTINVMLKVYSRRDTFAKSKQLFEAVKAINPGFKSHPIDNNPLAPDAHTYTLMLEASATSHQWEYFEHLYREMTVCGYQLDHDRHTTLLVEASKAGKCHILDHAFETILETGQTPHVSLFTEMICQVVAQQDYERTIPLINSMAHASMQFCEKQWTSHFERNRDRIGEDILQGFLEFLDNSRSKIVVEEPVSSLIKSLRYLCCGQRKLVTKSVSSSDLFQSKSISDNHRGTKHLNGQGSLLVVPNNRTPDKLGTRENYKGLPSERRQLYAPVRTMVEEDVYEEPNGCEYVPQDRSGDKIATGFEAKNDVRTVDSLTGQVDISFRTRLPSASDILETWKEKRIKDDIFPFQV